MNISQYMFDELKVPSSLNQYVFSQKTTTPHEELKKIWAAMLSNLDRKGDRTYVSEHFNDFIEESVIEHYVLKTPFEKAVIIANNGLLLSGDKTSINVIFNNIKSSLTKSYKAFLLSQGAVSGTYILISRTKVSKIYVNLD